MFDWPNLPTMFFPVQRCPVCEGRGSVTWDPALPHATVNTNAGPWVCPTCKGARVLEDHGIPPWSLVPSVPSDPNGGGQ